MAAKPPGTTGSVDERVISAAHQKYKIFLETRTAFTEDGLPVAQGQAGSSLASHHLSHCGCSASPGGRNGPV